MTHITENKILLIVMRGDNLVHRVISIFFPPIYVASAFYFFQHVDDGLVMAQKLHNYEFYTNRLMFMGLIS